MSNPELTTKRGDTLQLGCAYKDRAGVAQSLAGLVVRCHVRNAADALLAELTVDLSDQALYPGEFALSATPAETASWPAGRYFLDIQITNGAAVISSETATLKVLQDITHD